MSISDAAIGQKAGGLDDDKKELTEPDRTATRA